MKRESRLIEEFSSTEKRSKPVSDSSTPHVFTEGGEMFRNAKSQWLHSLLSAEKTCLKEGTVRKIHYKLPDEREMVEEYNTDTGVLVRRAWKVGGRLGGEGRWDVEVGDPVPEREPAESSGIVESGDQPTVTRRNTRINLEWRIRNLPYPIETYSINANEEDGCIVVRTTNKKYFKKLPVPELKRLNLPVQQANIQSSHKFNTLIILYKKPSELLEMEKELYEELKKVTPKTGSDIPSDCKPS